MSSLAATILAWINRQDHNGPHRQWSEYREAKAEASQARARLERELARRRGWRLTHASFGMRALRRGMLWSLTGDHWYRNVDRDLGPAPMRVVDHATYYRWPGGKAAAVVSQPYASSGEREDIIAWASANGLRAEILDYPSWHFPGQCLVVVFTSAETKA